MKIKDLEKIRAIDPAAAEYVEGVVFPRYGQKKVKALLKKNHVLSLFIWIETPQGWRYWDEIWDRINPQEDDGN